jgi:hypothetical protein
MIGRLLDFIAVAGVVYFIGPMAFDHSRPIFQALAIALLAFMAKDLLLVEPEIYIVNSKEDAE